MLVIYVTHKNLQGEQDWSYKLYTKITCQMSFYSNISFEQANC